MESADDIGTLGQNACTVHLTKLHVGWKALFKVHYLGDKSPTFDFLVQLNGVERTLPLPFFLVQVKATRRGYSSDGGHPRLRVRLSASEVTKMASCPIPTYLVGVNFGSRGENAYLLGIPGHAEGSVSSLTTKYPLNAKNRKLLWHEVRTFWRQQGPAARISQFIE